MAIITSQVLGEPVGSVSAEAKQAWKELEGRTIPREVQFTQSMPMGTEGAPMQLSGRFIIKPAAALIQVRQLPPNGGDGSELVIARNWAYGFILKRKSMAGGFVLTYFGPVTEDFNDKLNSAMSRHGVNTPWSLMGRPIVDWLSDPGFAIGGVTKESRGGNEFARFLAKFSPTESSGPRRREFPWISFEVDPARSWRLVNYEVKLRSSRFVVEAKYGDDDRGLPVLRRATRTTFDGARVEKHEATFQSWSYPEQIPDRLFTLSAFGLPEPIGPQQHGRVPNWVWCLLAAGLFGLIAIWLRRG